MSTLKKIQERKRKSVALTAKEINAIKAWVKKFNSKTEAFLASGVNSQSIDRAIQFKSCSPKTYDKLKALI